MTEESTLCCESLRMGHVGPGMGRGRNKLIMNGFWSGGREEMFKPKGGRWEMRQRSKWEICRIKKLLSVFPCFPGSVLCWPPFIVTASLCPSPPYHQGILRWTSVSFLHSPKSHITHHSLPRQIKSLGEWQDVVCKGKTILKYLIGFSWGFWRKLHQK